VKRLIWYGLSRCSHRERGRGGSGEQARHPALRGARHRQHADDHRAEHQGGAEVGLEHDERAGQGGQREGEGDVAAAGADLAVAGLAEDHREQHDHPDLGELRGLELEAAAHRDPRV
jgi:hypothetical protein